MRTSYSQNNLYLLCSKAWWWNYDQKLKSPEVGASLFFGSAVDTAIEKLLEGNTNYLQIYEQNMNTQYHFGKTSVFFDNPDVMYSYSDFDSDIINDDDINQLYKWASDLKLTSVAKQVLYSNKEDLREEMLDLYDAVAKLKKNPYKKMSDAQKTYFNRASWLSLRRKGFLLIEAFIAQVMPKIKKVVSTQQRASIKDEATGDSIQGFIDMVLEIEGYDKPIIFDLKTAARPYTEEQLEHSTQLTLYSGMKGADYNTNLVGYIVLCKNIQKDKVSICKSCGHTKTGRHKTCDNIVNKVRCNGEWDETISINPQIQVMVKEKTQEEINDVFMDVGNIISAMKQKIVYKDTSKCNNFFGSRCQYYAACHNNDTSGLVKK